MRHELELQWQKSRDGWIPFDRLAMQSKALTDVHGIYILWSGDEIVKIGKGRIRDGLVKDKTNRRITEIEGLMVTWAAIELSKIDEVLRFLVEQLKPRIADKPQFLTGREICVNNPWHKNLLVDIPDKT